MREGQRSLNLSNAVAVTVFEAWRQNGFAEASPSPDQPTQA
jgi:tRNA (cytidine/uridine-2'-O-)-methyltransferase